MVDVSGTGTEEASGGASPRPPSSRRTIAWAVGVSLALMIVVGGLALLVRRIYTDGLSIDRPAGLIQVGDSVRLSVAVTDEELGLSPGL